MLETRLECDLRPCAPVSSAFGASASRTFSPSCGLLDLVQAARVYVKLYEQFHDSACTSSISFSVRLPQNVWVLCLLELLCAWLPHHSTQSHSRDCSTAGKGVTGFHKCKRDCYGNTGFLAKTAYLYLRGLTSLPITRPGSIANANANCIQSHNLICR